MEDRKPKPFSRRDLLFGFMDRIRGREPGEEKATGISAPSTAADGLFSEGKWAEALDAYREVLGREAGDVEARVRVGICLYRLGKHTQAVAELGAALRKKEHGLAYLYLGLCHARRGEPDKMTAAWKKYFEPARVNLQREVNLQVACIEAGHETDSGQAADAVEKALAMEQG